RLASAEEFGQFLQSPVGRRAYRARTLAEGRCGALRVEAHDDAEDDGLGLVLREAGDEGKGLAGRERLDGLARRVGVPRAHAEFGLVAADGGTAAPHPYVVEGAI